MPDDIVPEEFDERNLDEDLPKLDAEEFLTLNGFDEPSRECVIYALLMGSTCQYIGSTRGLVKRIQQHWNSKKFPFDRVLTKIINPDNLMEEERYYISMLEPPYNVEYTSKVKQRGPKMDPKEADRILKSIGLGKVEKG